MIRAYVFDNSNVLNIHLTKVIGIFIVKVDLIERLKYPPSSIGELNKRLRDEVLETYYSPLISIT